MSRWSPRPNRLEERRVLRDRVAAPQHRESSMARLWLGALFLSSLVGSYVSGDGFVRAAVPVLAAAVLVYELRRPSPAQR